MRNFKSWAGNSNSKSNENKNKNKNVFVFIWCFEFSRSWSSSFIIKKGGNLKINFLLPYPIIYNPGIRKPFAFMWNIKKSIYPPNDIDQTSQSSCIRYFGSLYKRVFVSCEYTITTAMHSRDLSMNWPIIYSDAKQSTDFTMLHVIHKKWVRITKWSILYSTLLSCQFTIIT